VSYEREPVPIPYHWRAHMSVGETEPWPLNTIGRANCTDSQKIIETLRAVGRGEYNGRRLGPRQAGISGGLVGSDIAVANISAGALSQLIALRHLEHPMPIPTLQRKLRRLEKSRALARLKVRSNGERGPSNREPTGFRVPLFANVLPGGEN